MKLSDIIAESKRSKARNPRTLTLKLHGVKHRVLQNQPYYSFASFRISSLVFGSGEGNPIMTWLCQGKLKFIKSNLLMHPHSSKISY